MQSIFRSGFILTILCLFIFQYGRCQNISENAGLKIPCDSSRIGSLITNPIQLNGQTDYSLAKVRERNHAFSFFDQLDADCYDCVSISNLNSHYSLVRLLRINKDSILFLGYSYFKDDGICFYSFGFKDKSGHHTELAITSEGIINEVIPGEKKTKDLQKQIDNLLEYFYLP